MADPTAVKPPTFSMSASETQDLGFDASAYLADGETIAGLTVELSAISDGTVVSLSDAPTFTGPVISQILRGSELTPGSAYRLRITFNAAPSPNVWTMDLVVNVTP